MFKKEEVGGDTVIAQGVRLEGKFKSEGRVVIEGEVVGDIKTTSDILIGESALINANITALNAMIAGHVKGDIKVENKVEIGPTAEITGDINAKVLSIEAGAKLVGKCVIGETESARKGEEEEEEAR
jgi:cytoskeletal protein CcmA (bactofilin family)